MTDGGRKEGGSYERSYMTSCNERFYITASYEGLFTVIMVIITIMVIMIVIMIILEHNERGAY